MRVCVCCRLWRGHGARVKGMRDGLAGCCWMGGRWERKVHVHPAPPRPKNAPRKSKRARLTGPGARASPGLVPTSSTTSLARNSSTASSSDAPPADGALRPSLM